ncbi:Arginyl-tRNA--protein transferase 1 [Metarhizium rileyi]|uniref:arginyltransferase n=1 Tax=Metarhizium rileyi (strain RCEF 4871) TaxID=1649241 RepID=A0A5C6GPQ0_METRR|nr:Arginyl-tRNA--protein transferase 1 [Metarhizium rileyi]
MQTPEDNSINYEYISPIGYSYYANATSISAKFYQTLLDRCWRRSGKLLYRPDQRRSCCPHYTIRLDSGQFKPSRDQRQTVNRFNRFVLGERYISDAARTHPKTRQEVKRRDNEFSLVDRVHEAEYEKLQTPPEPAHKLVVTLEEDNFTEEKYQVYDNYQKVVHREPLEDRTPRAFKRFLCSSPLRREVMVTPDGQERKLGSFHQCYRLDGVLVAFGVLDLLPDCVSSVYFLYHDSLHKQTPGKLGAMHEIALAKEQGYRWWYPGFYIHNCPKMKYKIDYTPQYILDPSSLGWDALDRTVLGLLDQKPFLSLSIERQLASTADSGAWSDEQRGSQGQGQNGDGDENEDIRSLFQSSMPGITCASDMKEVDLDHIALKVFPTGPLFETSDLVAWDSKTITDWPGLKASVAELVAAIGPDTKDLICLDMARERA